MQQWFLLASSALTFFGITGITQKLSTDSVSFEYSLVWFSIFISIATLAGAHLDWRLTPWIFVLAAIGGLLNLNPLVTIVGAWISRRAPSRGQAIGTVRALVSVVLHAEERPADGETR